MTTLMVRASRMPRWLMTGLLLLIGGSTLAQELSLAIEPGRPQTLSLQRSDTVAPGRGYARTVTFAVDPPGPVTTLFLWAEPDRWEDVKSVDPSLELLDAATGERIAKAEDGGGGKLPFIKHEVTLRSSFRLAVALKRSGTLKVHLRVAHESRDSLDRALRAADDFRKLRAKFKGRLLEPGMRSGLVEIANTLLLDAPETPYIAGAASMLASAAADARTVHAEHRLVAMESQLLARWVGRSHPDLLRARANLAITLKILGKLEQARELETDVLSARMLTLDEDHDDVQRARGNLANTLVETGKLKEACELEEKIVAVWTRTRGATFEPLIIAQDNLGDTLRTLGKAQRALELHRKVLAARLLTLPDDHAKVQAARVNVGLALSAVGKPLEAHRLLQKALDILSRSHPHDDRRVQVARAGLATTLALLGRLDRALELQERVLAVHEKTLPHHDGNVQRARHELAWTLFRVGDLERALRLQEAVVAERTRTMVEDHPILLRSLHNLAWMLFRSGRIDRALEIQQQVLAARTASLPDDDLLLQTSRGNMAAMLARIGRCDQAKALQDAVLEVYASKLGKRHPDLLSARENLSNTLVELGDFDRAIKIKQEVLTAREHLLPTDHPDVQTARRNLAAAMMARDRTDRAGGLLKKALRSLTRTRPEHHRDLRATHTVLAVLAAMVGDDPGPHATAALEGVTARARFLASQAAFSSTTLEYSGLLQEIRGALCVRAFAADPPALTTSALRAFIDTQRLAIGARGLSRVLMDRPETRLRAKVLIRRLQEVNAQRAYISQNGETEKLTYRSLQRDRAGVLRELDRLLHMLPESGSALARITEEDIGGALQPHQVAVAFIRYVPLVKRGERVEPAEERYAAWIVHHGGGVDFVELCGASSLEDAADLLHEQPEAKVNTTASEISRLLVEPLISAVGSADEILCTLDSVLHIIPLESLPYKGGTVGDRLRILVYPSLRDVCVPLPGTMRRPALLALGDPAFDLDPATEPEGPRNAHRGERSDQFDDLAMTGVEVAEVAALFEGRFPDAPSRVLVGDEASKRRLLRSILLPRYIHLATHGYYDRRPRFLGQRSGQGRLVDPKLRLFGLTRAEQVQTANPWALCGIALAGANRTLKLASRLEGTLSGDEVAALDLLGTELVTVSACDSARGHGGVWGDAVFSLQAALHAAGARSVITALWRVRDTATRELMVAFYSNLWIEGLPKHEALRRAKKALRERKDANGKAVYTMRDWAAWVLTGDPN